MTANQDLSRRVGELVRRVRDEGDRAVLELARELDGAALVTLKVSASEYAKAESGLSAAQLAALDLAISNVRRFHEAQVPTPISVETMPGVQCTRISHPIDSVGLYVPAGTAPLPYPAR